MTYQQFRTEFKPYPVLSLVEIKKVEPNFDVRRLVEWQNKKYLTNIIRGWYRLNEQPLTTASQYLIANKIYDPSYISLESALAYYHLIPEGVHLVTSLSTKKTTSFETKVGDFRYSSVVERGFFGYELHQLDGHTFKIATLEKAIIDYCYFHPELDQPAARVEWRLNEDVVAEQLKTQRLEEYLQRWGSPRLTARVIKVVQELVYA